MSKEYATKDDIKGINIVLALIILILVVVVTVEMYKITESQQTLTQLAEAEGAIVLNASEWTVECINELSEYSSNTVCVMTIYSNGSSHTNCTGKGLIRTCTLKKEIDVTQDFINEMWASTKIESAEILLDTRRHTP